MSVLRFKALDEALSRKPVDAQPRAGAISDFFGENVFNRKAMHNSLPENVYRQVVEAMEQGTKIDREIADNVASAMKAWAVTKGATHYTHWFQPLTGLTAEKHESFFDLKNGGTPIEKFEGDQLVQQEPDASSFPSGGIRNTFEARGYTAWDPTSPAFVIGRALCIPTIFVAYTGEALDYKTPLLKALNAVDKAAVGICKYFDKDISKVTATLGWEQEYFLIDSALYHARPDLALTGRTLFGQSSSKGQQLEDHYFGSIPERTMAFMRDFETEALKLGIPVKTRHNEVAPNQFECAPVFEDANLAVDHNQLLMDLMGKVAARHNFKVLLHEKPFAGINGSGKHCNWSLKTNTGINLLSPGRTPRKTLMFLTFFINTIKAVCDYSDLLRASIASAGNDHRLGANEAPPAIISVFIGSYLTEMLEEIEKRVQKKKMTEDEKAELKLDIGKIPMILLDNTDRNRTSPFAFTGDKFEFRALGASANCASAMIVLNTIVAKQLKNFEKEVDELTAGRMKRDEAIFKTLQKYIIESKKIRFDGNNYSEEWLKEAVKRGLSNIQSTPEALGAFVTEKNKKLYSEMEVMSEVELQARYEIEMSNYKLKLEIESRMISDLAINQVIPAAVNYQNSLIANASGLAELLTDKNKNLYEAQLKILEKISSHISAVLESIELMNEASQKANSLIGSNAKSTAYCHKVKPLFEKIRVHVDQLELLVDNSLWPLPKYRELLFSR
ncbi:MAG: glutamine synthetase type III [Flavobacteriales bacterium]|nr:MAG: glutamine synthetase type III [Flavobacteriales bacterium]